MMGIAFVFFVIWGILSAILDGWVLKTLWNWFMVTTFGLVELRIASALGIALVIRYLTGAYGNQNIEGDNALGMWLSGVFKQLIIVALVLVVGFIVKSYL